MHAKFICQKTIMAASRRKKLMVYGGFLLVLGFAFLHVTYFSEAYSPLQVLSDAQSEARRLLKFITLYHYQCNNTIQGVNTSQWPVCLEKVGGLNLVLGGPRIMYSIGPSGDLALERLLALNYSYNVNMFHHQAVSLDVQRVLGNKTRVYKTVIVPNDPADYGRNSFETQTLNNVFETLKQPVVDVLKIDSLADVSQSHEVLYYMVKDHLLAGVRQLHLAIYIDKVDDDYLYSWYRALYMLFHTSGFRLYHTSSSDSLCLQVTLMESCIYYMTWIRDPGPETFILYPPAIDGTEEFEIDRLQDYMEDIEASCTTPLELSIPASDMVTLCLEGLQETSTKPCQLVLLRDADVQGSITTIPDSQCTVTTLEISTETEDDINFYVKRRRYERSIEDPVPLEEAVQKYLPIGSTNLVYIDVNKSFWKLLTHLLDSGVFHNVDQLMFKFKDLFGKRSSLEIRQRYSELQRIEAYGFRKYQVNDNKLTFHAKSASSEESFKLNYLKTESGRTI